MLAHTNLYSCLPPNVWGFRLVLRNVWFLPDYYIYLAKGN